MRRRLSARYTIVLANRSSGAVRRLTVQLGAALAVIGTALALPIVMGLSAMWQASAELSRLQLANATLETDNTSYRTAARQLVTQIAALQTTVTDLSDRATLDSSIVRTMENLPARLRSDALGYVATNETKGLISATLVSLETTFGELSDLLFGLERELETVQRGIDRREALARATPSGWPANGWLSSAYGYRTNPFGSDRAFHPALDISTLKGQPVFATADGVVQTAAYSGTYGNLIVLEHGFGLLTRYGHLSRFAVKRGAQVERGQVIGHVGSTGRSTGSHVHYEVLANGRALNPLRLLPLSPSRGAN